MRANLLGLHLLQATNVDICICSPFLAIYGYYGLNCLKKTKEFKMSKMAKIAKPRKILKLYYFSIFYAFLDTAAIYCNNLEPKKWVPICCSQ